MVTALPAGISAMAVIMINPEKKNKKNAELNYFFMSVLIIAQIYVLNKFFLTRLTLSQIILKKIEVDTISEIST